MLGLGAPFQTAVAKRSRDCDSKINQIQDTADDTPHVYEWPRQGTTSKTKQQKNPNQDTADDTRTYMSGHDSRRKSKKKILLSHHHDHSPAPMPLGGGPSDMFPIRLARPSLVGGGGMPMPPDAGGPPMGPVGGPPCDASFVSFRAVTEGRVI